MRLNFKVVGEKEIDGEVFNIERAVVTNNPFFFTRWRMMNKKQKKMLMYRSEGRQKAVYRLMPQDPFSLPYNFKKVFTLHDTYNLYPYQKKSVDSICNSVLLNGAALDGSDTGTGKTFVALSAARNLSMRPCIICRKIAIDDWKKACEYMKVSPRFIVNWEYAKGEKFPYTTRFRDEWDGTYFFQWRIPQQSLLIFDEAHCANHYGSQNSALYIASRGVPSISVSATIADRVERLKPLFSVLNISKPADFDDWIESNGVFYNDEYERYESFSETSDMQKINRILFPNYGYRLTYKDPEVKKFFPKVKYQIKLLSLSQSQAQKQNRMYAEATKRAAEYLEMGMNAEALVEKLRYRQASELLKARELAELATEYIYERKSVCIFVNFKDTLAYLAKFFKTRSLIYGNQELHGIDRNKVMDDFQNNRTRIIILMNEAGGQSINLHDTDGRHQRIALICPTYNPVTLKQVMGRTFRAGGKSPAILQLVFAAKTIETEVAENVLRKIDNIAALNDGDMMEPDIFNLFGGEETK